MKRFFDVILALILLVILIIPMLMIALLIKITSQGPMLYWSDRIGQNNVTFKMPKFRTMRVGTPAVATHLIEDPDRFLTSAGKFLRKFSFDELPQLFSIMRGDMSFVGPRPALFNQKDLIQMRTARGIHRIMPGLTGWAQINGRDDLPIPVKVDYDKYYLTHRSLMFDIRILLMTFYQALMGKDVKH